MTTTIQKKSEHITGCFNLVTDRTYEDFKNSILSWYETESNEKLPRPSLELFSSENEFMVYDCFTSILQELYAEKIDEFPKNVSDWDDSHQEMFDDEICSYFHYYEKLFEEDASLLLDQLHISYFADEFTLFNSGTEKDLCQNFYVCEVW